MGLENKLKCCKMVVSKISEKIIDTKNKEQKRIVCELLIQFCAVQYIVVVVYGDILFRTSESFVVQSTTET